MEQRIKDRFNDTVLQETMRRYSITAEDINALNGFESFIFEFRRDAKDYILRITHSIRRSENMIRGEVEWINFLADGGVSVARAIHSQNGNLVELVEDPQGGHFLAAAFVKAPGRRPWEAGWTPERYENYGALLGKMHALTENYQPANPAWKRREWDDPTLDFVERFLPAPEALAKQKYKAIQDHLRTLPKDRTSYGLIHQDAHQSNFFMDEDGSITIFDFDDCDYSWFINDIAIVLFYISLDHEDAPTFTQTFMSHFLRGYRQFHALDAKWLKEIPVFLKMREIELYAVVHRDFDVNNIDNEWCAHFMRGRKERIENDVSFMDFDFESLATVL